MTKLILIAILLLLQGCTGYMSIVLPPECIAVVNTPNEDAYSYNVTESMTILVPIGTIITIYPVNGFAYNITSSDNSMRVLSDNCPLVFLIRKEEK